MFLGHFGLGFAGKRVAPRLSLGALFLAVQFADLLFWVLALLGIEHFRIRPGATRIVPLDFYDYPISRSLLGLAVWGLLIGGAYWLLRRDRFAQSFSGWAFSRTGCWMRSFTGRTCRSCRPGPRSASRSGTGRR